MSDQVPTLADAREAYVTYLRGTPLAAHAAAILDFVGERGEGPFGLQDAMNAAGTLDVGQVISTLTHLTQSKDPALSSYVVFVDEGGTEHQVKGQIFDFMDGTPYAHPVTGETVSKPADRMFMRFEPLPGLLREQAPGMAP